MPDMFDPITDEKELERLKGINNPNNEPTGHYSGRCSFCGSKDLWDDFLAYGCNTCGRILNGQDIPVDPATGLRELRTVPNGRSTEECEWCGQSVSNGRFLAKSGYAEGPFLVGDCCGDRRKREILPHLAGPLLKQQTARE